MGVLGGGQAAPEPHIEDLPGAIEVQVVNTSTTHRVPIACGVDEVVERADLLEQRSDAASVSDINGDGDGTRGQHGESCVDPGRVAGGNDNLGAQRRTPRGDGTSDARRAAGPWVTRHVAPLVDRVEVLPWPKTSNTGAMRQAEIANLELDAVRRTIDDVNSHAPSTPVSSILFIAIGTSDEIEPFRSSFASPVASGHCGSAEVVASNLQGLADLGLDYLTVLPLTTDCESHLADCLFG